MRPRFDAVGNCRERRRRHRNDAIVADGDRLGEMMALAAEAPRSGLGRRAEHREREALRRTLTGAVAARRQDVLQQHDVPCLGDARRRPHRAEHIPGGFLLRRAHLLEPQARLDVARRRRNNSSRAIPNRSRQTMQPCACRAPDPTGMRAPFRADRPQAQGPRSAAALARGKATAPSTRRAGDKNAAAIRDRLSWNPPLRWSAPGSTQIYHS